LKKTPYIKLFANCIPVKGAKRGAICDLQRNVYIPVPLSLIELFDENHMFNKLEIEKQLNETSKEIFNEYLESLEKQEFIFHCHKSEAKKFPLLSMEWDFPSQATNIIIDIDNNSAHDYKKLLDESFEEVNCRYVQFRHFGDSDIEFWQGLMDVINNNSIKALDIVMKDSPDNFTHEELSKWVYENRKIRLVTLHSSTDNKEIRPQDFGFSIVMAVKEEISNQTHCGVIHHTYFSPNIETFTESQLYNTCLNRKIGIDVNGEIKNCPSMEKSYGNIKDTKLEDVVNNPEFQEVWRIKKDEITKCKDCEFRHICTDCRAYLENPDDMYSAPLKCGYDPYNCKWEEWSINSLKEHPIEYYGMQDLLVKEN